MSDPSAKNLASAKAGVEFAPHSVAPTSKTKLRAGRPELSLLIPVYNEQSWIDGAILEFIGALESLGREFELILCENGSDDETLLRCKAVAAKDPRIRFLSLGAPNYGAALRAGIFAARGRIVICEELDICAAEFWHRALAAMSKEQWELVVGSKAMRGAQDRRPWQRRLATREYNRLLRILVGFRGTDTHGLKVFRRESMLPVAKRCVVQHDVFASELVIRAQRIGLRWTELPVHLTEKRAPSVALWARVPKVLRHLMRLTLAIRAGIGESQRQDVVSSPAGSLQPTAAPKSSPKAPGAE